MLLKRLKILKKIKRKRLNKLLLCYNLFGDSMKKVHEKGKFFFLVGLIFIIGGFYIDNMDAGRIMLELLGIICFVFGMMSIKQMKRGMSILFFSVFLFMIVVIDYGVVKYLHKAPVFAIAKEENSRIHYYGAFYEVWQCDQNNPRNVQFSNTCEESCISEKNEIKYLEEKLTEQEKTSRITTTIVTLKERTGITDQTGEKEYVLFTRLQMEPLFGAVDIHDLTNMKIGKKYRITFEGEYQSDDIPDNTLFHDLLPIKIEEVSDDTLS